MTLKEAAIQVLSEAREPLTAEEVHDQILGLGLFQFRTASGTQGVVTAMLKRHAAGAHSCTPAKEKTFELCSGERYKLR